MESHLKFRGSMAPRLYFFDDTKGKLRKYTSEGLTLIVVGKIQLLKEVGSVASSCSETLLQNS